MSPKQTIELFEREAVGPSARQDEEIVKLFAVTLRKPAGGKLGFAGMPVTVLGRSSVRVVSLKPGGLFDIYNRTCEPGKAICPGDCIMCIGDAVMDADHMMEQLVEADEIHVLILSSAPTSGLPGPPGFKDSTAVEPSSDIHESSAAAASTRHTRQSLTLDTLGSLGLESTCHTRQSLTLDTLGTPGFKDSTAVEPNSDIDERSTAAASTRHTRQSLTLDTLGSLGLESTRHARQSLTLDTLGSLGLESACHARQSLTLDTLGSLGLESTRHARQPLTSDTLGSLGLESTRHARHSLTLDTLASLGLESESSLEDLEALESKTTIMLRQLPPAMSREALTELLNAEGFAGMYDFAYLPRHFSSMMSFGCAFVNLVTPEAAKACLTTLDGYSWHATHDKACVASWAESEQGLEANIKRYQNSPVMHGSVPDECKPAVFRDGLRIPFPAPTVSLKAPRKGKRSPLPPPPICPPEAARLPRPAFVQAHFGPLRV